MEEYVLPNGWKYVSLGDLADVINGVSYKPDDVKEEGIRILRSGNVHNGYLVLKNDDVFLDDTYYNEKNTLQYLDNCITASTGSIEVLGKCGTVFEEIPNCQIGAFMRLVRSKTRENALYLSLMLHSPLYYHYIRRLSKNGTSINNINNEHLEDFSFPLPPKELKEEISTWYFSIEKKIALNTRMNAELEAMAKQLYDYWFVQFDFPDENGKPYKTSGGKMVWDEKLKREIPEGWEVKNVFDVSNVLYGFPFSTDCFVEDITKNPIVRIRDIIDNTTSAFTVEQVDETYRLKEGDLLIGMDGNFHMNYWHNDNCYINQRCVRFRDVEEKDVSSIQLYYNIKPVLEHKQKSIIGSTVGHLLDSDIKDFWVIYPSITYRKEIKQKFKSILYVITNSIKEKVYLTSVRDSLLPMLMNGQVTVE